LAIKNFFLQSLEGADQNERSLNAEDVTKAAA
jgi:hypothetical protein